MPASLDPTYPLFPFCSFLGFLVSLIPLPWHIQAWNSGTCAFMIWTSMACLIEFVNSLVWRGNIQNPAPIWCDISSKLLLGVSIGIPASTLCISRRLYNITAIRTASVTRKDKRNLVIVDLCIAIGIPVLAMILHVVVQPHRFDILEDIGCYPAIYNTLPAYFLYFSWPVVLGIISFVYSGLTLRSFWIRRVQFNQLLSSNSSMNPSRYFRLMLLAVVDMMFTIPLTVYSIYIANKGVGMAPWISWQDTHFNFGRIGFVPTVFWRGDRSFEISVELTRWLPVFCAFLFFALFGFASEAKRYYSSVYCWVAKRLGFDARAGKGVGFNVSLPGWKKIQGSKSSSPHGSLPMYISKPSQPKKLHLVDSFSSFGGNEVALDTYTETDVEKSGGSLSTPASSISPAYSYQPHADTTASTIDTIHPLRISPQSSRTYLQTQPSHPSLRAMGSHDRIYISDAYRESPARRTRTPSPAPFSDVVPAPFHRPFTPPSVYPITLPHAGTQSLDVIHVVIHKQSTEAL